MISEWILKVHEFYDSLRPVTDVRVTDGWSPVTITRLKHVQEHYPEVRLCVGKHILESKKILGYTLALDPREFYYAFPCYSLSAQLIGINLRAVRKEFRSHYAMVDEGYSRFMPFGFFNRPEWECKKPSDPVWVCEGIFDSLALQMLHPYVIAGFGGSLTWGKSQVIASLAKNVVCYFDSDEVGKRFFESFKACINGHQPDVVVSHGKLSVTKDPGELLEKKKSVALGILAKWNSR